MKKLRFSLSSVILAALLVPIIMTYRIFPSDTNFIQFGLIFLGIFINFVLDVLPINEKKYTLYKYITFWSVLALAVGGAFISAIIVRHLAAPTFQIHDIILQLEAAVRFFIDGSNPWASTYHNTFMASWNYSDTAENPALYHFVMMPFYLLFSLPFSYIANNTIGYFDGRIPLFVLYLTSLISAFLFIKEREKKLIFTSILALNPAMFAYTLEGRSDVFMFAFLFVGLIFLGKKKFTLAGIILALAFSVKQSVWPLLPLYVGYIYFVSKKHTDIFKRLIPFIATFTIIVGPFLLWDVGAFLNSTVFYLSGNTLHSYPISGYGLGVLLHQLGLIQDLNAPYPFVIWQVIFVVPILIVLLSFLKRYPNVKVLLFSYALLIFVYWYMSRYFNNSHVGYLTMIFATAYFWPDVESDG